MLIEMLGKKSQTKCQSYKQLEKQLNTRQIDKIENLYDILALTHILKSKSRLIGTHLFHKMCK